MPSSSHTPAPVGLAASAVRPARRPAGQTTRRGAGHGGEVGAWPPAGHRLSPWRAPGRAITH